MFAVQGFLLEKRRKKKTDQGAVPFEGGCMNSQFIYGKMRMEGSEASRVVVE